MNRVIQAKDLFELKSVADPRLSPSGDKVAYVETKISKDENEYISNIFVLDLQTNKTHQWTFGNYRNHSPRWSPDGNQLAFVSNRAEGNQIFILDLTGGEARQLTNINNGAENPVWSPDGKKVAFTIQLKENEQPSQDEKNARKEMPEPLEIEKMQYKMDGIGFFRGKYRQIGVVDVESEELEILTEGPVHKNLQGFTTDSKFIIYSADYSENTDFSFVQDIYLLNLDTNEKVNITNGKGIYYHASGSPDGKYIACVGHEREFENATLNKIYLYNVETKEFTNISTEWDIHVGDVVAADFLQGVVSPGVIWSQASSGFYFTASYLGNVNVYYSDLQGKLQQITEETGHIYGLTMADNKAIAAISYPTEPCDLYEVNLKERSVQRLTSLNKETLENIQLSEPESFVFKHGDTYIHGWLMKPTNFDENKKYPLILEIHGGPHTMYANTYFHEFQMLAASGFAILYTNPRGSHGYGQSFVDAVRGNYGKIDYEDVMAAVDYAIENYDFIDTNRLGVTGGSYGGFMTNWIIGHTDRFKAAVTQRSISNWISFYGCSDIGYYFTEWQHQLDKDDIEGLWKISPLAYVNNVKTPLLILHSEEDLRCPIEQAEQLFIALKHRGKETKFIRFPKSNHELSRSGIPNLRVKRLEYINDWFKQYFL